MESVKPWVYTTMKVGLITIAISVMFVLAIVFSPEFFTDPTRQSIVTYSSISGVLVRIGG